MPLEQIHGGEPVAPSALAFLAVCSCSQISSSRERTGQCYRTHSSQKWVKGSHWKCLYHQASTFQCSLLHHTCAFRNRLCFSYLEGQSGRAGLISAAVKPGKSAGPKKKQGVWRKHRANLQWPINWRAAALSSDCCNSLNIKQLDWAFPSWSLWCFVWGLKGTPNLQTSPTEPADNHSYTVSSRKGMGVWAD